MRSRAVSLPCWCCRSILSGPPPRWSLASSRRKSSTNSRSRARLSPAAGGASICCSTPCGVIGVFTVLHSAARFPHEKQFAHSRSQFNDSELLITQNSTGKKRETKSVRLAESGRASQSFCWERGHPCPLSAAGAKTKWRIGSSSSVTIRFRVLAHAAGKDARAPSDYLTVNTRT